MKISAEKLRKILVDADIISADDFDMAVKTAEQSDSSLENVLINSKLIPDRYLGQLVAEEIGYPFANLSAIEIPDHILRYIPEKVARNKKVVAFAVEKDKLKLAMSNPADLVFVRSMEKKTGLRAIAHYVTEHALEKALEAYTKDLESALISLEAEHKTAQEDDSKIVRVVNLIMDYAYQNNSSDVHIEPREKGVVVRYRIDGILHDAAFLPKKYLAPLVTRIKILSRLRTDDHFSAQDGKFQETIDDERIDVRVSIIPIVEVEKVVIRLLSDKGKSFDMEDLGLDEDGVKKLRRYSRKSFGMILSTGPTGSGKTTSLYAILKELNTRDVNIATIEDPIEYAMEGVNQIQVNNKTGLTFATGLRSIVRQDPDIVMVGEIRDPETASIAINASMTGHLVLSTLHTNDAATTLPRFQEMGVEPFLIASTINVIIAQRLVRKICNRCIMTEVVPIEKLKENLSEGLVNKYFKNRTGKNSKYAELYRGKGCDGCNHSGYVGRIGIFEILEMDDSIRELVMNNANSKVIQHKAIDNGMVTMLEDGLMKVLQGITTIDEVLRVTGE